MVDFGPLQATVPPLCQEAWCQQVCIQGEVKLQAVATKGKLVEDPIRIFWILRGSPALHTAGMVRQEVGQEVAFGIHSGGVNHFIVR